MQAELPIASTRAAQAANNTSNGPAEAPDPDRPPLPIDPRSAPLLLIALLAGLYALHWAGAVIIPVLLALMCGYALKPLVDRLQRWRIPRTAAAATVMLAIAGGVGSMVYSLGDDATAMIESLPEAAQKLRGSLRPSRGEPEGPIAKVQRVAEKIEQAAEAGTTPAPQPGKGVTRVQVEPPKFNVRAYLWSGTLGLAGLVGQTLVVLFIAFFLLASGDGFRRKLVKLAGPRLSRKKITVQVLDAIDAQIRRYLLVQIGTSVLVGVATWITLLCFGMERAAAWGVVAAALNLVPYVGAIVTAAALALVAFLQFGTAGTALAIGAASMAINTVEGNLVTPWLAGRAARMNPVLIFVGVLAFGWLWGLSGLLLGAPLLMATKVVCDHVESLEPIGELLGE
jgi:predicted PurR-regulated permease PerM